MSIKSINEPVAVNSYFSYFRSLIQKVIWNLKTFQFEVIKIFLCPSNAIMSRVSSSNFNLILLNGDFCVKLLSTLRTCSIFSPPLDIIMRAWNVLKIVSVVIAVWLIWPFRFSLDIFCSFQLQHTAALGERFKRTNTVFFGSLKQSSCKSLLWFVNSFFSPV